MMQGQQSKGLLYLQNKRTAGIPHVTACISRAVVAGWTLVTNHESGFRRVRGLKIQNWAV